MNEKTPTQNLAAEAPAPKPRPPQLDRELATQIDSLAEELGLTGTQRQRTRRWVMRIGALLRHTRTTADVAQAKMAAQADIKQPYLSRLENGLPASKEAVRGPSADVLLRCADALGCDIEIAMRSKETRQIVGSISSAELSTSEEHDTFGLVDKPEVWTKAEEAPLLAGPPPKKVSKAALKLLDSIREVQSKPSYLQKFARSTAEGERPNRRRTAEEILYGVPYKGSVEERRQLRMAMRSLRYELLKDEGQASIPRKGAAKSFLRKPAMAKPKRAARKLTYSRSRG